MQGIWDAASWIHHIPSLNLGRSSTLPLNEHLRTLGNISSPSLVKEIVGYEGNVETDLSMPDGNPRKLLDSTLINNLGWKSKVDLKTGLKLTYDWYIRNL